MTIALTPLTKPHDIKIAYGALSKQLKKGAKPFRRTVGWPGGHRDVTVWWHERHRFWTAFSPKINPNHYWTAFGVQNPKLHHKHRVLEITCEANPSRQGVDRRCAGLLLTDPKRNVYLGHNGKVGGGRKGIGKSAFLKSYRGKTQRISWNDGKKTEIADVIVLGKIDSPNIFWS